MRDVDPAQDAAAGIFGERLVSLAHFIADTDELYLIILCRNPLQGGNL